MHELDSIIENWNAGISGDAVKFGENVGLVCEHRSHEKHTARFIEISESIRGRTISFTEYALNAEQTEQSNEMCTDIGVFCMLKFDTEEWQNGVSFKLPL
jgi:superfamily I DNA and/or RNA helicase